MRTRAHDTNNSSADALSFLAKHVLAQLQRTHPATSEFRVLAAVLLEIVEVHAGTEGARESRKGRKMLVRGELIASRTDTSARRETLGLLDDPGMDDPGMGDPVTDTDDPEICS